MPADDMPQWQPDKKPGCGCLSLGLLVVAGLSVALLFSIRALTPARDSEDRLTESGSLSVTAMRAGDCIDYDTLPSEIQGLDAVPCAREHKAQVYAAGILPEGEFPGSEAVGGTVDELCADAVGRLLQNGSDFAFVNLVPTSTGWSADRGYLCLATSADGSPLVGDGATSTGR
jgi:hypothetical protein